MSKTSIDYEPRGDRVVVRRLPRPAPKPGEVVIPHSQQKLLDEGIVVAVGPGLRNRLTAPPPCRTAPAPAGRLAIAR